MGLGLVIMSNGAQRDVIVAYGKTGRGQKDVASRAMVLWDLTVTQLSLSHASRAATQIALQSDEAFGDLRNLASNVCMHCLGVVQMTKLLC